MRHRRKKLLDVASAIILFSLIVLDGTVWKDIAGGATFSAARIYFLPMTQGESALLVAPGAVTMMTDAGSDETIVDDLQKIMPSGAPAYIDLAIISSPQSADYEGYQYLLAHYQFGAFIYNGRSDTSKSAEWQILVNTIIAKHIPLITVGAGDRIRYESRSEIDILSPSASFVQSPNSNDTRIIQHVLMPLTIVVASGTHSTTVASSGQDLFLLYNK
jgi:beta-lactamase superfamily II metal-dependent hydrolase